METITITRIGEPGEILPEPELHPEDDLLPGGFDAQGNPHRLGPVEVSSAGWYIPGNNGGAEEQVALGESDVMKLRIYNHSAVDVRPTDQVTIRGRVWKVVGDIESWQSPFGSTLGGTAVTLERAG